MNLDFLKKIRRNHALEHATIAIALSKSDKHGVVAGNSTQGGFFVYGDIPDDVLSESASEALERLKAGEKDSGHLPLLWHQHCGGRRTGGTGVRHSRRQ